MSFKDFSQRLANHVGGAERLALNGTPHSAPIEIDAVSRLPSLNPAHSSTHWSSFLWYSMLGLYVSAVPIKTGHVSMDVDSILGAAIFKITEAAV